MPGYFTEPDTTRLTLADGAWVEIKTDLSYGEDRAIEAAGVTVKAAANGTPQVAMDLVEQSLVRLTTWIVDWSFTDRKDRRVKPDRAAIMNLRPAIAREIDAAITQHVDQQRLGKADPATETASGATSPL